MMVVPRTYMGLHSRTSDYPEFSVHFESRDVSSVISYFVPGFPWQPGVWPVAMTPFPSYHDGFCY